jgi:hypothetical protein
MTPPFVAGKSPDIEERRFPATGMADDRDVFAFLDIERHFLQHLALDRAADEGLVDVIELEIGRHYGFL